MNLTVRLLFLVALAILPALLIEAYNEYALRRTREAEVQSQAVRLGEQAAAELRQVIEGVQRVAVILAQVPLIGEAARGITSPDACSALLVRLRQEYPGQLSLGIANREGRLVCTTRGNPSVARVRGGHFQRAMQTGQFVIGGYGESGTGDRFLSFAYPLRDGTGEPVGAIVLGLDLTWLAGHMRQRFAGEDAVVGLSDRDLTYLMRLPDDNTQLVGKPAPAAQRALAGLVGKGAFEAKGPDGVTRVAVFVPISMSPDAGERPDLIVAFGLSKDAAFKPIDAATRQGLILLFTSLVLALLAAWIGGRYFVHRPVQRLLAAAVRWREGDYATRVAEVNSGSEFSKLGAAFNAMAEGIAERTRALQASEDRFRSLANLVPAFVWFSDAEGNIRYMNERWYGYTGQTSEEALASGWANVVHPDDVNRTLSAWAAARSRGDLYEIEVRYRRHDGAYRWFLARAEPLHDETGRITGWFGSSTDIDALKRAEEHRTLLINELNHRVKNTLATVQSIASQSLRAQHPEQGRETFEARLFALARTHDVLTRENWESASLRDIVLEAIQPYQKDRGERFDIEGPFLRIPPGMALPISMCLHELLTNAVKYGALSVDAGRVVIAWSVDETGPGQLLRFRWEETGGPLVVEPTRAGFGTRLIQRSLSRELGGEVEVQYPPTGVVCLINVPLKGVGLRAAQAAA
ncbi:MAG TPA: HWE histidine kinase domain-containing protein [Microvirga sp.]|nr:HWE histidine kinase domain-containing protein [Microvirga sp.]